MPGDKKGSRPRSRSLLVLDLKNAYTRLGVSPMAGAKEISDRIGSMRKAAITRLRAKGKSSLNDPDQMEIDRLTRIEEEIGDERKRKIYDERHPQNIVLTVQTSPAEQAWQRHRRAGLISQWVQGELGDEALCPTPTSVRLWAPSGLDDELRRFLSLYVTGNAEEPARTVPGEVLADDSTPMLSIHDIAGFFDKEEEH